MTLRIYVSSFLSFALGAALFTVVQPAATHIVPGNETVGTQDNRAADREAIRTHIDKIFIAYVDHDCATIKATHATNWIGFPNYATSIVRGLEAYMSNAAPNCRDNTVNPLGLSSYNLTEIDYLFYGDVALVPYVADVSYGKEHPFQAKLRSLDIYAKINGEWNQVGSNIGPHPTTIQAQIEQAQEFRQPSSAELQAALKLRESVWRAYFSNDRAVLEKVIPGEVIAIDAGREGWANRASILSSAAEFARSGGKLVRLEFPKTEIQWYGNVAIFYTTYLYDLDVAGRKTTQSGRATEIFVRRDGGFVNAGWHLDSGNAQTK